MQTFRRQLIAGWGIALVVAILIWITRGNDELGPVLVFGAIAIVMSAWTWRRPGAAAYVASLVLGLLWTLQFLAYAAFGLAERDMDVPAVLTDALAVVGGVLILVGAVRGLRSRRDALREREIPPQ